MTLAAEILDQVRAKPLTGPLVDPREGRTRLLSLSRSLGVHVEDETHYAQGRAYRFHCAVPTAEERRWRTVLHVLVSAVGPFVTHNFLVRANQDAWWASVLRTSRIGFFPEDAALLERL
ncbi:MAG TPA: hypothetical protein VD902_07345, partial [Symbiobacteriaceae bacterium]|nr:hypothetical protein [Symbiobacteriaceae bacterium]